MIFVMVAGAKTKKLQLIYIWYIIKPILKRKHKARNI